MSEHDTMHSISLMIQPSHISPATAVWCDPGVRVTARRDHRSSHLGLDVWCDPGVWLDPAPPAPPLPAPAPIAQELPELSAFDRWLPRFEPDARVALPTIPAELTFEERVTQRCHALAKQLGWGDAVAGELLTEVLRSGTQEHRLIRLVEDHDLDWSAQQLHAAWELRSEWNEGDGPQGPRMSWDHAVCFTTCWYEELSEEDEPLSWLDDAFRSWARCRPFSRPWYFFGELSRWLEEDGSKALFLRAFPWEDGSLFDPAYEAAWR